MTLRCFRPLLGLGVLFLAAGQCHADMNLLVAEYGSSQITSVAQDGTKTIFATGNAAGLDKPIGLGINPFNNEVYAVNNGTTVNLINTVSRYSSTGTYLGSFGQATLDAPQGIAFDTAGNLYVSNNDNTIREYTATGTALGIFANTGLNQPYGMTFDSQGNLYVANLGDSTIEKFSSTGTDLGVFTTTAIDGPSGLAIGPNGNLYVTNFSTASQNPVDTITEYNLLDGSLVSTVATSDNTGLSGPIGIAFGNTTGDIYIANNYAGTIERFQSDGTDLGDLATGFNSPTFIAFQQQVVPEPSSVILLGLGVVGMLTFHSRRQRTRPLSA